MGPQTTSRLGLLGLLVFAALAFAGSSGAGLNTDPYTRTSTVTLADGSPATVTTTVGPAVYTGRTEPTGSNTDAGVTPNLAHGIWYRSWSATLNSALAGVAWSETQKGVYYYSGNFVWVRSRWGWDNLGWHRCGYSSGVLFTISVKSCWKQPDPSSSVLTQGDQFQVTVFFQGFPISNTIEMRTCFNPFGDIWACQ
jgi:hypothetical protein